MRAGASLALGVGWRRLDGVEIAVEESRDRMLLEDLCCIVVAGLVVGGVEGLMLVFLDRLNGLLVLVAVEEGLNYRRRTGIELEIALPFQNGVQRFPVGVQLEASITGGDGDIAG